MDLKLTFFLLSNNLHAVVSPLAVFGMPEDQFVFAFENTVTANSFLGASYSPLTEIFAFVVSDFYSESSLNFYFRGSSSILAPFEPVLELSLGANQESSRYARHYHAVDVFANQIERHSGFYVQEL